MSDYWRGRGGPMRGFRGGFRGRGGPGLFVPPAYRPRQELTGRPIGGSKLAMDREVEMEEAKKASASALASASVPPVEPEATEDQPVFGGSPARGGPKWGHEAFESIRAVDTFQANRSVRGRGRGAFAGELQATFCTVGRLADKYRSRWFPSSTRFCAPSRYRSSRFADIGYCRRLNSCSSTSTRNSYPNRSDRQTRIARRSQLYST